MSVWNVNRKIPYSLCLFLRWTFEEEGDEDDEDNEDDDDDDDDKDNKDEDGAGIVPVKKPDIECFSCPVERLFLSKATLSYLPMTVLNLEFSTKLGPKLGRKWAEYSHSVWDWGMLSASI